MTGTMCEGSPLCLTKYGTPNSWLLKFVHGPNHSLTDGPARLPHVQPLPASTGPASRQMPTSAGEKLTSWMPVLSILWNALNMDTVANNSLTASTAFIFPDPDHHPSVPSHTARPSPPVGACPANFSFFALEQSFSVFSSPRHDFRARFAVR